MDTNDRILKMKKQYGLSGGTAKKEEYCNACYRLLETLGHIEAESTKIKDWANKTEILVLELTDVLRQYEQLEADLITDDGCWHASLPCFTQEIYDRFIELQTKRSKALAKAKEVMGD